MRMNHFLGGILLISGTTIGAGMLALPVMTSFIGFFPSVLVFSICWFFMLLSAYFFLDVNLTFKGEANFISMVEKTIGNWGKIVSWIVYLLLLYSLTAAYIAASAPLFASAIHSLTGYKLPDFLAWLSLPILFGGFVYLGTLGVDLINRLLMLGLCCSYFLLVGFLPGNIDLQLLTHVDFSPSLVAIPVIITSFGYHIIIPSLTTYMNHDRKKLRLALLLGSLLPLLIYILWELVILGIVPLEGQYSLVGAWKEGVSATKPLIHIINNKWIRIGSNFFSFFAIITSFLGVTLSLSDFLTDGLKIKKSWEGRLFAWLLTFIPPMLFVFTYERGFIIALEYAGAFVAILLIFFPALMAWHLKTSTYYQSIKGRSLLLAVMLFAVVVIVIDIAAQGGYLKPLISKYLNNV